MAYVPGFDYDLFISYSHADEREWVGMFEQNLRESLGRELGVRVSIWQDVKEIRVAEDWKSEIEEGIKRSAAFLTIVSPSYRTSRWCGKERACFLNQFCTVEQLQENEMPCLDKMKVGTIFRLFKVIKAPWANRAHEKFLPRLQHANFFNGEAEYMEFTPGTDDFRRELRRTTAALVDLLRRMRSRSEKVFVSCPAQDMIAAAEKLREQLHQKGYNVAPVGVSELDFTTRELVEAELEQAVAAVFVLGAEYDPFVTFQLKEAARLGVRPLIWIDPEARGRASQQQAALLESVGRLNGLPATTRLLTGTNDREMISAAVGLISAPAEEPAVNGVAAGPGGVYLICDPTEEEDRKLAEQWRSKIEDREALNVFLPSRNGFAERHEQLLKQCEGVLLFRKCAPFPWLQQNAWDVCTAERLYKRPPLRSKCFVVDDPSPFQTYPVQLVSEPDRVDLGRLEPFLARLRKTDGAYAGG
ncbi:MAG: toll/interleukin-1 receptor domain-containing protein [Bryobacterales bacterium]|nr:toll/interleukin-1 receptor domain-containing protein [Bryobacterales bacterium]